MRHASCVETGNEKKVFSLKHLLKVRDTHDANAGAYITGFHSLLDLLGHVLAPIQLVHRP